MSSKNLKLGRRFLSLKKYPQDHQIVDGENLPVRLDHAYAVSDMAIDDAIGRIIATHGEKVHLLPLSGSSGGAGVFQVASNEEIIGLHIQPCIEPVVRVEEIADIRQVCLDEIFIDRQNKWIYAGSAVNLNQLNQALATELGSQYRVLGADLTSYTYAQVGACFMTGGMGPQRRYFSDSVRQIALHNGRNLKSIEGDALNSYMGTYGWTGIVSAVCCNYVELPMNEIAFALPVNNTPDELARLVARFSPYTRLCIDSAANVSSVTDDNLILGMEHITAESMSPFLNSGDNALTKRAAQLRENCEGAGADGLIFVNGFTNLNTDEFLFALVDDMEADDYSIAGVGLEYTEIFKDPEQMRAIREAIPYAARMQVPKGNFSFKGHTDTNICLNPDCVEQVMNQLWQLNQQYVASVQTYFDQNEKILGEILVYGHLNPVGIDPHNRITFACDDESVFRYAVQILEKQKHRYICQLAKLCEDTGSDFVGGEKSAGSEYEMLPVFGDIGNVPSLLRQKAIRQKECIRAASPMLNWRAMKPYR